MPRVHSRLLWKGTDRHRLNKLQNALNSLKRRDNTEAINAGTVNFVPFFFAEDAEPAILAAMDLLLARVATLKAARA